MSDPQPSPGRPRPVLFVGPSLAGGELPTEVRGRLDIRPPAACGDIERAVAAGAERIGLVDGVFETRRPPWHKEILHALAEGVSVLGAASMGALRAVEMEPFGMRGVGRVFRLYRSGALIADDEVAVLHMPAELGSRPLSEALVTLRVNLRRAVRAGAASRATEHAFVAAAQAMPFREREARAVLAAIRPAVGDAAADRLAAWLEANRSDVKREDALRLVDVLLQPPPEPGPRPSFVGTIPWSRLLRELARPPRRRPRSG